MSSSLLLGSINDYINLSDELIILLGDKEIMLLNYEC